MAIFSKNGGQVTDGNDRLRGTADFDWFELTKGVDVINADAQGVDNPDPDSLFATNYQHDVVFDMKFNLLRGIGERADGGDVLKVMAGFENYYANPDSQINHTVYGNDAANFILGGAEDDRIGLSAGGDNLNGKDGVDTLDGSRLDSGITVNLKHTNDSGQQFINTGDTIYNFENVVGTDQNDVILGNDDANTLEGGAGDDRLYGYGGDDSLIDHEGNDLIAGLDGNDRADIGEARLTGYFESPALLALLGVPRGGFLSFTRADGSKVNVHESTERITVNGDTRRWFEYYDERPVSFDTTVTIDADTHSVPSETQALTNTFLVNSNQLTQSTDLDGNGDALVQQTDMTVQTSHWSDTFAVNRVARSGNAGDYIQGKQLTYQMGEMNGNAAVVSFERAGSILQGSDASDTIRGLAGTDIIDAKGGNDLVHGGNAADVISGGSGADELHGDFGKNTYLDQADGSVDLIAIKSDQHLMNWWYGTDGNNTNGQKADVIERLDANDQIKIIGVATEDLAFRQASIHGLSGIGIFADGSLEAIYTGGDLSSQQLQSMTTGDASDAAMNNQIWSYNFGNDAPHFI